MLPDNIYDEINDEIDDFSNFNNQEDQNPIKVIRSNEKIECYYIDTSKDKKVKFVEIDLIDNKTIINPINTIANSLYYLKPKYQIEEIIFEGFNIEVDKTESYDEAIYGLPMGFIKTLKFGLGIEKKYKILLKTISKYLNKCERLTISNERITSIENNHLIIDEDDFDKIRRGIDRNEDLFQREATSAKEIFIYDNILNFINPEKYPKLTIKPRKDVIYKLLRNTNFNRISKKDKDSLLKLKDSTDLSYLSVLTNEFEEKLTNQHKESTYQTFFEENPLLLTMISGSPYVQFKSQAYVGGKSFENTNGQYPDFLQKNKITNNTFIIEIKTPQTSLLEKVPYRKTGVYSASKDLTGSISQILTQKYQLETDIATLIKNADDRNVEAYNVQGLLMIGTLSSLGPKEMKRSFELIRNNQKNLRIITYDECLEQLKTFIDLLSKNIDIINENDMHEEF
jgi:hypothetical protein